MLGVEQGIAALRAGQVLAWPTEGVWGLGCLPNRPDAVRRLLDLKGRSPDKGLILIAARVTALAPYIQPLDAAGRAALERQGQHPITWLAPAAPDASPLLRGIHDTQAVRITRHPLCLSLCEAAGALVSTSANQEGLPPARTVQQVGEMFGADLDGIVDGPLGDAAGPSEIRDLRSGQVVRSMETA